MNEEMEYIEKTIEALYRQKFTIQEKIDTLEDLKRGMYENKRTRK